jgi:nitric oxide reductase large subunit
MNDEMNCFKIGDNLNIVFPEFSLDGFSYNKISLIKQKEYKQLVLKIIYELEYLLQANYNENNENYDYNNNYNNNKTIKNVNKNNKNIKEKKYYIILLIIILILLISLIFFICSYLKYKNRVEIISEKGTKYINLVSKKI